MKKTAYVLQKEEYPDIDELDCRDFKVNFQRGILLSLLEKHKLTQSQFEACMDMIVRK